MAFTYSETKLFEYKTSDERAVISEIFALYLFLLCGLIYEMVKNASWFSPSDEEETKNNSKSDSQPSPYNLGDQGHVGGNVHGHEHQAVKYEIGGHDDENQGNENQLEQVHSDTGNKNPSDQHQNYDSNYAPYDADKNEADKNKSESVILYIFLDDCLFYI